MAGSKLIDQSAAKTWLFTDLDGTLIPLEGVDQNRSDLSVLGQLLDEANIGLVYVTGRHVASAAQALIDHGLPMPRFMIGDVGATIAEISSANGWKLNAAYVAHLKEKTSGWSASRLIEAVATRPSMRLQEKEKLGPYKVSYYADADQLGELTEQCQRLIEQVDAPYSIVSSVDPFNGDGLIDFLPSGVDKAYAAKWLAAHIGIDFKSSVIFSGDSGNDSAALLSGCRAILVGNAAASLVDRLCEQTSEAGALDRLFVANASATSGVLEGLRFHLDRSRDR